MTLELRARVRNDEDLLLDVASAGTPSGLIRVLDTSVERGFAAAQRQHIEAKRQRDAFAHAHADALVAERKRAEMERIREALSGDDPSALREALAGAG